MFAGTLVFAGILCFLGVIQALARGEIRAGRQKTFKQWRPDKAGWQRDLKHDGFRYRRSRMVRRNEHPDVFYRKVAQLAAWGMILLLAGVILLFI